MDIGNCVICNSKNTDDGSCITSSSLGSIFFCRECWEIVYHAVYENLNEIGALKDEDEE